MSRTVPANVLEATQAQETGEVVLYLLTVTSADLAGPLHFVDNTVSISSRGNVYSPAPFSMGLPADLETEIKDVTLTIDAVNREIINAIRTTQETISILVEVIVASDPDTVLASADFDVQASSYRATDANLSLGFEPILIEPFPAARFTPSNAPGLY